MPEITPPIEKKQNYPGLISQWCGFVCVISFFIGAWGKGLHENSLYTNDIAGYICLICGIVWFFSIALGLLCWFISLFLILPIWGTRFRATGILSGILLPMIVAGFIMPTLGKVHPRARVYYPISDPVAVKYIKDVSKASEKIDGQFIKDTYEQNYSDYDFDKKMPAGTITVKYERRTGIERTDLPKSFTVIIDRKTKKTEIKHENDVQQKAE
jgi:hypothetical protein